MECGGSFCSRHRKPETHNCPSLTEIEDLEDKIEEIYELDTTVVPVDGFEIPVDEDFDIDSKKYNDSIKDSTLKGESKESDDKPEWFTVQSNINRQKDTRNIDEQRTPLTRFNLVIITVLLISVVFNGFLYLEYRDYLELSKNYAGLYNTSIRLQSYYDNVTTQYMELRDEYIQLNELYAELMMNKAEFEKEHFDIMNYQKNILLVDEKTIILEPNQNYTEIHEVPFSGYIFINYSATGEVYTWIGSSDLEEVYYSRNPQFPGTASSYNFTVPVLPNIMLYLANPNGDPVEVTYWVNYTY